MNTISESDSVTVASRHGKLGLVSLIVLILAALIILVPTMRFVAQESWGTEQGAHGPIVLATGLWLLVRLWPNAMRVARRPSALLSFALMAVVLVALYSLIGGAAMRQLWFPLLYIAFIFPPPESIVWAITMPMKIGISNAAVWLLGVLGYPIGAEGVVIYVGQYELLVAAACSGLNSIISLSAITLFYIYLRHEAEWQYALFLTFLIVPVALIANFVRVLILILLTYHAGEAAAQGFLHNFAGIVMFVVALLTMFGIDSLLKPLWDRVWSRTRAS